MKSNITKMHGQQHTKTSVTCLKYTGTVFQETWCNVVSLIFETYVNPYSQTEDIIGVLLFKACNRPGMVMLPM